MKILDIHINKKSEAIILIEKLRIDEIDSLKEEIQRLKLRKGYIVSEEEIKSLLIPSLTLDGRSKIGKLEKLMKVANKYVFSFYSCKELRRRIKIANMIAKLRSKYFFQNEDDYLSAEREYQKLIKKVRMVVVGIVLKGRKVLIVKQFGNWILPSGGVRWGESLRHAMIRELNEELNLKNMRILAELQLAKSYHITWKGKEYFVLQKPFICLVDKAKIKIRKPIQAYKWVDLDEAIQMLSYPNLKSFLKMLKANL